jgi:hypothetical protein
MESLNVEGNVRDQTNEMSSIKDQRLKDNDEYGKPVPENPFCFDQLHGSAILQAQGAQQIVQ